MRALGLCYILKYRTFLVCNVPGLELRTCRSVRKVKDGYTYIQYMYVGAFMQIIQIELRKATVNTSECYIFTHWTWKLHKLTSLETPLLPCTHDTAT